MLSSTKNSAPIREVDKNMLDREILHVLKDNDLSLNIWFKRRDMDYAKGLKKKIWTHKGPSTKEKNDEHLTAHALKKRRKNDGHVSK